VNVSKTNVVVFSKGKVRKLPSFTFGQLIVDVKYSYTYLGVTVNYNGKFRTAISDLINSANRALFKLKQKMIKFSLLIDISLKLYNTLILPILTYSCEIWGDSELKSIEQHYLCFCKHLLCAKKSTPSVMIYGELGSFPISSMIKKRMTAFCTYLSFPNSAKLSSCLFKFLLTLDASSVYTGPWLSHIKRLLTDTGIGFEAGLNMMTYGNRLLANKVERILKDQYIQNWHDLLLNSSKCIFYLTFKCVFGFEEYLLVLPKPLRVALFRLRTRNHRFPIETGAWYNIDRHLRKCPSCLNIIGDECHYLLECKLFHDVRQKYIIPDLYSNLSMYNCVKLMNCTNEVNLYNLAIFCKHILNSSNKYSINPS
jgi:hypothetical protein